MRLQAIGTLVPDGANVQLIFLDAKGRFGLRELNVGSPQLLIARSVMFERSRYDWAAGHHDHFQSVLKTLRQRLLGD
jgi:hypothetical protein